MNKLIEIPKCGEINNYHYFCKKYTVIEMTQLILNIEDTSILPSLKKILGAISGISIKKSQTRRKKSEMELALEDKARGRIVKCKDKEDLFNLLGL